MAIIDQAVRILIKDPRSDYAKWDSEGRMNIKLNYYQAIQEGLGTSKELEQSPMTHEEIADWYAKTFWRE